MQVHARNRLGWFRRSIVILACCTTVRPVKLPLLLRNRNDDVYFVLNLKIIDDAVGVVVYSCIAEDLIGGGRSGTQELIRACVASPPALLRRKTGSLISSRHGVGMMEDVQSVSSN